MTEIKKLDIRLYSGEFTRYSLFLCDTCGSTIEKVRRFGLIAKSCSHKCYRGVTLEDYRGYIIRGVKYLEIYKDGKKQTSMYLNNLNVCKRVIDTYLRRNPVPVILPEAKVITIGRAAPAEYSNKKHG